MYLSNPRQHLASIIQHGHDDILNRNHATAEDEREELNCKWAHSDYYAYKHKNKRQNKARCKEH